MKGLLLPDSAQKYTRTFGFVEHFDGLNSARWTSTLTDSGTAAVGDEVGGVVTLSPSDGTVADNDEAYIATVVPSQVFPVQGFSARMETSTGM